MQVMDTNSSLSDPETKLGEEKRFTRGVAVPRGCLASGVVGIKRDSESRVEDDSSLPGWKLASGVEGSKGTAGDSPLPGTNLASGVAGQKKAPDGVKGDSSLFGLNPVRGVTGPRGPLLRGVTGPRMGSGRGVEVFFFFCKRSITEP